MSRAAKAAWQEPCLWALCDDALSANTLETALKTMNGGNRLTEGESGSGGRALGRRLGGANGGA